MPEHVQASNSFSVDFLSEVTFPNDWDLGEGEFRWRGRSSYSGKVNYVNINWGSSLVICFLAEFTNLDNSDYAQSGYLLKLKKDGVEVAQIFIPCALVKDEDLGDEPTVIDRSMSRTFAGDINSISIQQHVRWK
jgi:hypothetical protein